MARVLLFFTAWCGSQITFKHRLGAEFSLGCVLSVALWGPFPGGYLFVLPSWPISSPMSFDSGAPGSSGAFPLETSERFSLNTISKGGPFLPLEGSLAGGLVLQAAMLDPP